MASHYTIEGVQMKAHRNTDVQTARRPVSEFSVFQLMKK